MGNDDIMAIFNRNKKYIEYELVVFHTNNVRYCIVRPIEIYEMESYAFNHSFFCQSPIFNVVYTDHQ